MSAAPIASGGITPPPPPMTVQPIVSTRKNVPMNSAMYLFGLIGAPGGDSLTPIRGRDALDRQEKRRHAHQREEGNRKPPGRVGEVVLDHFAGNSIELDYLLHERVVEPQCVRAGRDVPDHALVNKKRRYRLTVEFDVDLPLPDIALERAGDDQLGATRRIGQTDPRWPRGQTP